MTALIEELRYVHLGSADPAAAADFAVARLGMERVAEVDGIWHLRADQRASSLMFSAERTQAVGLKVRGRDALDQIAGRLAAHGIQARRDQPLARRRMARELLSFQTPGGITIELVWRPLDNGWRFFPAATIAQTGLAAVALRSTRVSQDEALLVEVLGLQVRDWIGDAAYLGFDEAHHRLALHPSSWAGVLAVEFQLDCLDQLMQAWYRLRDSGEEALHGPGRRPFSEQAFLTFAGPDQVCYSVLAEGRRMRGDEQPRQFASGPQAHCAWGSACRIADYGAPEPVRGRRRLHEVGKS